MKRTILTLLCFALIGICAEAQNATKAKQILDKAASQLNNKGGASANFKISGSKTGTTSGQISIKGNKFFASTPEASMWFNGKTQWTYLKSSQEVNVTTPNEAQQARLNPYKFITLYKSGYTLSMKNVSGGYEVHLVAQSSNRPIKEMYITVNSKSYLPTTVKLLSGGSWTTITISNFRKANLSDSMFTFNSKDFPKAEIIDLR